MERNRLADAAGLSLMELLVVTALTGIILVAPLSLLKGFSRRSVVSQQQTINRQTERSVEFHLRRAIQAANQLRLEGNLSFSADSAGNAKLKIVALDAQGTLTQIALAQVDNKEHYCGPKTLAERSGKAIEFYRGLAVDEFGNYQLKASRVVDRHTACPGKALYRINLRQLGLATVTARPLILIPITESYELSLNAHETLYYWSELTGEKQPLVQGVKNLQITKIHDELLLFTVTTALRQANFLFHLRQSLTTADLLSLYF
ncbi:hypothetical protein JNK13_06205 [bacterium]|nr:hypothetical protein [bacterium]